MIWCKKKLIIALPCLILISGCKSKAERIEMLKGGVKFGYYCAEQEKTLEQCEALVNAAIVKAL